jgi:hypothetical protein
LEEPVLVRSSIHAALSYWCDELNRLRDFALEF